MKTSIWSHAKAQKRKGLRKLPGLMLLAVMLLVERGMAEPPEAPAKAIPVEEEEGSAAEEKPKPLKTPLTTFGGVNWVNKQIQRNIKGAVQTGFNLPVTDIPGLGARVSGRYELDRLGAHFRRSDQISWTLSYGAGFNPAGAALNAAGATVPLSVSASVSRTQSSIFTRQSPDYWEMALDGVYLPTSIPRSSADLDTLEVGTMLSIPVQTSFGPGVGMEKVVPLFGQVLGDQALIARAGAVGSVSVSGSFDVHLYRRSEHSVGLIIQSGSSDGYSAGIDVRIGTEYLNELADGQYRIATKRVQSKLRFSPLSATLAAGSRNSGATLYHEFDLTKPEHREVFDSLWGRLSGVIPMFTTGNDLRNARDAAWHQFKGGADSMGGVHTDRVASLKGTPTTLVRAVTHAGSSFSRSVGANLPLAAKVDAHILRRLVKYTIHDGSQGSLFAAQAESQSGHGTRWLMGFAGEGEVLERSLVRSVSSDPASTTKDGITEIGREHRLSVNSVDAEDATRIMAEIAIKLGPVMLDSVAPQILHSLSTAAENDGVVAIELTAGLTEKGTAALFEVLARHLHLEPKEGELILASLLRSKFDQYLAALDEIRLIDPERTALAEFQRQGKTLKQRLLGGGDREQDSIKITAAFLNTMYRTWAEASESEREEMMCEFAALLETDPVLKQVGIGYLAFIVAGEQGTKPSELYRLTLRDRTLDADSQVDEGAYDVAHRIDDAWQLSQRGHASAFDLFLRWAPRAQPVREDTSPTFEVTRQIGPPDNTTTVPVPMNLIPLVPPGRP
ncbi:MAG: hypothetical protein JNN17_08790 [Verrucomicrobiaceae bacterium]|nr:hypothetical protein [Verrucomicrobiaceae bacterium]